MLKKQLMTLACVAAILVCGACGLMFNQPEPPRPRMHLFAHVHTLRVVVTNSSATKYLDPALIQREIIGRFNLMSDLTHLTADKEGDADATLSLDIVKESGGAVSVDPQRGSAYWYFEALADAKLTRKSGQVLWEDAQWNARHTVNFRQIPQRTITPGWSEPWVRADFATVVAKQLVHQITYR